MKKAFGHSAFAAGILVFISMAVTGQPVKQSSLDVIKVVHQSERRLDSMSFRSTMVTEWFTDRDGDLLSRDSHYFAVESPGRYHWISESAKKKVEEMVIGDSYFKRVGDQSWEVPSEARLLRTGTEYFGGKFGPDAPGPATIGRTGRVNRVESIAGKPVTVYEIRHVAIDGSTGTPTRTEIGQYWINAEGVLLQRVLEQEVASDRRFARIVTVFDYSLFRIEGPVIF